MAQGYTINNGRYHFNVEEWECTDPNSGQFCHKESDGTFTYLQLNDDIENVSSMAKNALAKLNGTLKRDDVIIANIDVDDYTEEEIANYLSAYDGILDNVKDEATKRQLIAECIFETDIFEFIEY